MFLQVGKVHRWFVYSGYLSTCQGIVDLGNQDLSVVNYFRSLLLDSDKMSEKVEAVTEPGKGEEEASKPEPPTSEAVGGADGEADGGSEHAASGSLVPATGII